MLKKSNINDKNNNLKSYYSSINNKYDLKICFQSFQITFFNIFFQYS